MSRKPKLVIVQTLVPVYLRDDLRRAASIRRRTLSAYLRDMLTDWYSEKYKSIEMEKSKHGSENDTQKGNPEN